MDLLLHKGYKTKRLKSETFKNPSNDLLLDCLRLKILIKSGKSKSGSQVDVVVISHAVHLYDPGLIPRLREWAEICRSLFDSEGFSPGTPVFLPLQIRLSRQDLSRRAIKH